MTTAKEYKIDLAILEAREETENEGLYLVLPILQCELSESVTSQEVAEELNYIAKNGYKLIQQSQTLNGMWIFKKIF